MRIIAMFPFPFAVSDFHFCEVYLPGLHIAVILLVFVLSAKVDD